MLNKRERNNAKIIYTRGNDLSRTLQGAGGIGGLLARSRASAVNPRHAYYHADANGNITAMVNTNGIVMARYSYDPYGHLLTMSGPLANANTYRFSSKEFHANSGLYYFGYRYYAPSLQRWLNSDPLGDIGSLVYQTASIAPWSHPDDEAEMTEGEVREAWVKANQNLYGAIGNNPVNYIDAFGLECDAGLGPGSLNPENLAALDTRTAAEIAQAKLKRSTLDAIQKSKVFEFGKKIDVNKVKQALNPDQLRKAKEIAQEAVRDGKEMLKKATTDKQRQTALNFIENQLNRARACKQALAP